MFVSASTYLDALFLLLGDNSDRSRGMVKELLDLIERQENKKEITTSDDELIEVYKSLIKTVINEKITQENETAAKILLLRIKSNNVFKSYPVEKDVLTDVLMAHQPISADQIDEYLKRIRNALLFAEVDATARKIFAKNRSIPMISDVNEQEAELLKVKSLLETSMKNIEQRQQSSNTKASETFVSMSDPESIKRSLTTYMDRSVKGVIKTGLQGLNRAFGDRGGLGLGETAVFAACSHNYKSGILISWLIWTVLYNKIAVEPGKRALIYFISLENEVHQNLMIIFKALYGMVEKKSVNMNEISTEFIEDWILQYFKKFDVDVYIDRYTPHDFTFSKFVQRYNAFIDQDFQMILFDLDYMSEARGIDPGDTISPQGQIQMIKENYVKFHNHAKQSGYALTTGHQLTRKAEELAGQFNYAVKRFNFSHMADSQDVHRTVDCVFFMHLEKNIDEVKFLTMQNRKNRGNMDTPEKDKFFAYPFTAFGIEDDFGGFPKYLQDIDAFDGGRSNAGEQVAEGAMF